MRRFALRVATTILVAFTVHTPLGAQTTVSTNCGVGIPQSEATGYVGLPRGDVFCPLLGDPKSLRSFGSWLRARSTQTNPTTQGTFDTNVGAVGISDFIGLGRWNGSAPNDGIQVSLSASVFAQFDLRASSFDLLNADYIVGLPVTFRRGAISGRVRVYHQSSHLGDEFLLRPTDPEPTRDNLSFESAELLLSYDAAALRVYAGGEYLVRRNPDSLSAAVGHAGAEFRPRTVLFSVGPIANVRLVGAVDVKVTDEQRLRPATSAVAGFEISRRFEKDPPGRRWMILAQFYSGPSPYGQFYRDDIRYYGVGAFFTP